LVSNEILSQAIRAFEFDIHFIQFVSNPTNEVFKGVPGKFFDREPELW